MATGCTLCPRECNVERQKGQKGFCGATSDVKIARVSLHHWEEPCISGKNGSGTVFFSGCNMKCVFCQNYEISTLNKGYIVSAEELAECFLNLQNRNAHNINLVTPTHYADDIIKALDIAKKKGLNIPVVYNSGGYEKIETLKKLKDYIDIYIPDFKYFNDKYAIKYSSANDYCNTVKNAIDEMYAQTGPFVINKNGIMEKGVIVRHLMLPGLLFDTKKIIDYLYDSYGDNIYLSIMSQYTPMPNTLNIEKLNKKLSINHYNTMINYCEEKGIKYAFIQGEDSADKCYIPEFYDKKGD